MKVKLSITIDDTIYNMFKHKPNISRYIQEVLREELIEQQRDSIASRLANQLKNDDDFKRSVKGLCHDYMEERKNGYWND